MTQSATHFTVTERDTLYNVLYARRDMRHFLPGANIDEPVLQRLFQAAHSAPSVGLMQPWRFIRIRAPDLRQQIASLVDLERLATAQSMGERNAEFMRLKVEGIRECAELFAVVLAPDDGTVFGRRTMPQEMALCSAACAIQNLWLASRAENIGMGWVSLFDPQRLAELLSCPAGAKPLALLCLGPVQEFYSRPMLEQLDWRQGKALSTVLMENGWQDDKT
jgi:5,6-dimethylbenzimidazole synthase